MIETDESDRGNGLLDQPSHRLNHDETVRGLHPCPFQPIVKNRILISQQVEARRHDSSREC